MKKTLNITMGGRVFAIEDDAYERLSRYLTDIRNVFSHYADADEIVADMEDRMADQFENQGNISGHCVSVANVETLIATMGSADDLRQTMASEETPKEPLPDDAPRKLFRNPDDKMLLGVCSGLAAYFGIDATFVRLAFVIGTLLGGSGVLLYLILYFIMPEAKTTTEKMAMRGQPITLAGVVEQVKSEFSDEKNKARFQTIHKNIRETSEKFFSKNSPSTAGKIGRLVQRIIYFFAEIIRRFFERVVPLIVRILGVCILLGGIVLLFLPIAFGMFLLTNSDMVLAPWTTIISHEIIILLALLGMAAGIIPAILIALLGLSMLRYKNTFPRRLTAVLIVVWICILIGGGATVISHIPRWDEAYARQNAPTTITTPLPQTFTSVRVVDGYYEHIRIVQGPTTSVRLSGGTYDIAQVTLQVKDNELLISTIRTKPRSHWHLFYRFDEPEITIVLPRLERLITDTHSSIELSGLRQSGLKIIAHEGSIATADSLINTYDVTLEDASEIRIESGTSTIRAELRGRYTNLDTLGATVIRADLKLSHNATAHLGLVTGELTVTGSDQISVYYLGTPHITKNISITSDVSTYPSSLWDSKERSEYTGDRSLEEEEE